MDECELCTSNIFNNNNNIFILFNTNIRDFHT